MFGDADALPKSMSVDDSMIDSGSLDSMMTFTSADEEPFVVSVGHNLGRMTWGGDVTLVKLIEWASVANDPEKGEVAQRPLDLSHARGLGVYMLKGLVNAAITKRKLTGREALESFPHILHQLGSQPYFSLQPFVANIRDIDPDKPAVRATPLKIPTGETRGFQVFLPRHYRWWMIDGQHRLVGAQITKEFLDYVTKTGSYPARNNLFTGRGKVTPEEMVVWMEALECARSFATVKIELHLGLSIEQERQLFHDLNNLGKKVTRSLSLKFDGSNPITKFIDSVLVGEQGLLDCENEQSDWAKDDGCLPRKDIVATNAIAFLNKGNITGATPAIIEPRMETVSQMWGAILKLDGFNEPGAKMSTVAAQPVVIKAIAKVVFDLAFSNRRPDNGDILLDAALARLNEVDFSHGNPMWRYYDMSQEERSAANLDKLAAYLPDQGQLSPDANRDLGSYQSGLMRFGAKHNDIYPLLADMIRWKLNLPSRHTKG
ncbi:DNA sulfur modification protein DndB [uncultured Sphingomonas sp.]|uniref:DNA sulfur modification protein DndB n=1 Tax=uncultured Sphingomonas sp. TaxID=158754 RepID=UPI0035C97EEB